jgi:Tol biopolymer transport system component
VSSGMVRRLVLAVGIAALALGAVAAAAGAAAPRIVYGDSGGSPDFNSDLFSIRPDGTHKKQLTSNAATEFDPAWSRKHDRIAFGRLDKTASHVYTMRANGFGVHRVPHTSYGGDPAWAPNGKKLAIEMGRKKDFKQAIFTIGLKGKHRHRLTAWSAKISSPDWSPTGKSIVYKGPKGITRMRANGTHKKLVHATGHSPTWSPDGKRIAFSDTPANPVATSDIYTIRINGTHKRNLTKSRPATNCPDIPEECSRDDESPAWSPNGKRVVFAESSSGNGDEGMFTVKADGTGFKEVNATGSSPDW